MKIKISFQNSGGELDSRIVESPIDAAAAVSEMALEAGELDHGDKFIITDLENLK